jgi:oligopeptide/dipeptide ABC transporter ATP-binding protein
VSSPPLVEVVDLEKHFPLTRTAAEYFRSRSRRSIHAVDRVTLSVHVGEALGLIGESGSGKTTLGWLIARLHEPTAGTLRFEGEEVGALEGTELRHWRRNVQVVFQDPVGSLDPRLKVWQIVGEPVRAQDQTDRQILRRERRRLRRENARRPNGEPARPLPPMPRRLRRAAIRARVRAILPTVGLLEDCLDQYPHEFSGGGRQRLSLARALIVRPKLVVLDEPTSALDVAVQAQILNRLVELQRETGVAYLLITHNVAAVRYVADRVAVMYLGQIVEIGAVRAVLERPVHPYTKALLAAVPVADARRRRSRFRIGGDVPSLIDPPPGCRFAPRCPFAVDRCRVEDPALREVPGAAAQMVACHRAEEVRDVAPASLLEAVPHRGGAPVPATG